MPLSLENFADPGLDPAYFTWLLDRQGPSAADRYHRLWEYYSNPRTEAGGPAAGTLNENSRGYFQAQETGLPARITGVERTPGARRATDIRRKEVVIENDIAWRIDTMVDFLFGRTPTIRSRAASPETASVVEAVVEALFAAGGGLGFFQELALLGAVYGFVDIALRPPAGLSAPGRPALRRGASGASASSRAAPGRPVPPSDVARARAVEAAGELQLECIEAPRVLPVLRESDYRTCRCWMQRFYQYPPHMAPARRTWLGLGPAGDARPQRVEVVEILSAKWWQRYEDRDLVAEGPNPLGRLPVVHVQNLALPGAHAGRSDVEPLVPLQDELNTRLSDRAQRVTYQSFRMYLGKGIDDFLERPVGPGQMWSTANPQASIEEFGSDPGSPSEDAHIDQVRQALDKVSGVTPLAAGLIRGNVGHLTSATALKVLLGGLLARTQRKRLTYATGIAGIVELCLDWLDVSGVLATRPEDRRVEVHWPNPLPADEAEQLRNAEAKARLGVPPDRILAELGYDRPAGDRGQA